MADQRAQASLSDMERFSFKGNAFNSVRLVKVYDGDTVTVAAPVGPGGACRKVNCRLQGINARELRGPDKEQGKQARGELLRALEVAEDPSGRYNEAFFDASPHYVDIACGRFEKYGRVLVEIAPVGKGSVNMKLCDTPYFEVYGSGRFKSC
jgi:endonuclease YncB( thermonuclease family)